MISECGGNFHYIYEGDFFLDVARLMILVIPAAIGYALWRIFVTNRARPVSINVLGLDENSAPNTDVGISWQKLFLYGLTGLVFGFEVYRYLLDLL